MLCAAIQLLTEGLSAQQWPCTSSPPRKRYGSGKTSVTSLRNLAIKSYVASFVGSMVLLHGPSVTMTSGAPLVQSPWPGMFGVMSQRPGRLVSAELTCFLPAPSPWMKTSGVPSADPRV